jgi:hypothetical protein
MDIPAAKEDRALCGHRAEQSQRKRALPASRPPHWQYTRECMTTHASNHGPPMPMRSPDLTSNEMLSRTFGPSCLVRQQAGRRRWR